MGRNRKTAEPEAPPVAVEDLESNFKHSLFRAAGAAQVWERLIRDGATNDEIAETVRTLYGRIIGAHIDDGFNYGYLGGDKLAFWHEISSDAPPSFQGSALVAEARRLLGIPQPKTPIRREIDTDRINEVRQRWREATAKEIFTQATYKRAKKEREGAAEALARVLDEEFDPPTPSLFDGIPSTKQLSAPPSEEDETWKAVPLSSLALSPNDAQKLQDNGIGTIGELSAWLEPKPGGWANRLTDIKGIGEAAAEKILAALDKFWEERNRRLQATLDAAEQNPDGANDADGDGSAGDETE